MCASRKELFLGLVRRKCVDPLASMYGFGEQEYELFFINDSDKPIMLKEKSFGGFKTYEDSVAMETPKFEAADILVNPHSCVFYCGISEWDFEGANQYQAIVETGGEVKVLTFYLSGSAGYLGSLIPCLNKYGRIIHPQIKKLG